MKKIETVCVVGAGIMGAGITQVFAQNDHQVTLYDLDENQLARVIERVKLNQGILIEHGLLTKKEAEYSLTKIHTTSCIKELEDADIVFEAIVEDLDAKQELFKKLETICRKDTFFATNTSGLSIEDVCKKLEDGTRSIGTNWWNPAHLIPLVEVTKSIKTSKDTADCVMELLENAGKAPVLLHKEIQGFIGNRLQFAIFREALNIVEKKVASFEDVDRVMRSGLGLRYAYQGPFETADLGGIDTFYHISEKLFGDLASNREAPEILENIYKNGDHGIKTGKGFYGNYGKKEVREIISKRDKNLIAQLKLKK